MALSNLLYSGVVAVGLFVLEGSPLRKNGNIGDFLRCVLYISSATPREII